MQSNNSYSSLAIEGTRPDSDTDFFRQPNITFQFMRLNATFVKRIAESKNGITSTSQVTGLGRAAWRGTTEWENPVWGWMLPNFVDRAIQLFLPDGTFYAEVCFGGPFGTREPQARLSVKPSKDIPEASDSGQLDALTRKLADPRYFEGFWYMIATACKTSLATPSSTVQYLSSNVGMPLALVSMGWSLELGTPPMSHSTNTELSDSLGNPISPPACENQKQTDQLKVCIGSSNLSDNGLVGYFDTSTPTFGELNFDYIRTFFAPKDQDMVPLKVLNADEYPHFTPFRGSASGHPYDPNHPSQAEDFDDRRNAHMTVFGAIADPFMPIRAYSTFLRPVELLLPEWTWQNALSRMAASLHMGPLLIPSSDVPANDENPKLATEDPGNINGQGLIVPRLPDYGEWTWLQPYVSEGREDTLASNPLGTESRDDLIKPGLPNAPYTAIEGYLQLRNSAATCQNTAKNDKSPS
ncbi:hypothetical protein F5B22DRAFT_584769 [Xylaria bambusicola]|uniref:uncharacterized protein n=1 Tax=Xylaria bambusicola TaxID=326684 RepID=UPI00200741E8|nr:uncharacterized protein F5B22DRAFT_584769 [Xylaria bambusicola]KAI0526196.1 hypothetical protein F5B22DRAFT_584769 [Xylaria bambusicola]